MPNFSIKSCLHRFSDEPSSPLPEKFNFPHQYVPNDWVKNAAKKLQQTIPTRFQHNFDELGKMFGVMVVTTPFGVRFLAGFSGKIDESTHIEGFVPPIYDTLSPYNLYQGGEQILNQLTEHINRLSSEDIYTSLLRQKETLESTFKVKLAELKGMSAANKQARDVQRKSGKLSPFDLEKLNQKSKSEQIAIKLLKKEHGFAQEKILNQIASWEDQITALKKEREQTSIQIQHELFKAYELLNFKGGKSTIYEIFKEDSDELPPSGTGECALPKLLHYAAMHNFTPLCFGEFWWGKSPVGEVRKHGEFYPACRAKCEPILAYQLQGLRVETNPILELSNRKPLEIIHEDAWILAVNKPENVLSVPGRTGFDSVEDRLKLRYPELSFLKAIHRLDMGTSGILLFAKDAHTHSAVQKQFASNKVTKCYEAILDGKPQIQEGTIALPLRLNLAHRPHQMVCHEFGKKAITYYKVITAPSQTTRIEFYPKTGRTHQIRVHAAHQHGLNTPIKGDELYGQPSDRLYLHARELTFLHPNSLQKLKLEAKVPF